MDDLVSRKGIFD